MLRASLARALKSYGGALLFPANDLGRDAIVLVANLPLDGNLEGRAACCSEVEHDAALESAPPPWCVAAVLDRSCVLSVISRHVGSTAWWWNGVHAEMDLKSELPEMVKIDFQA